MQYATGECGLEYADIAPDSTPSRPRSSPEGCWPNATDDQQPFHWWLFPNNPTAGDFYRIHDSLDSVLGFGKGAKLIDRERAETLLSCATGRPMITGETAEGASWVSLQETIKVVVRTKMPYLKTQTKRQARQTASTAAHAERATPGKACRACIDMIRREIPETDTGLILVCPSLYVMQHAAHPRALAARVAFSIRTRACYRGSGPRHTALRRCRCRDFDDGMGMPMEAI
ncbi:hypothetical protein B0T25DRAFT_267387 [Lasiosphaeria hispida]|uniref:Uncharacterized protein n=1 Tax=Lasiosphaeria hispida TaxID=260671 RepID=A0AAJ0HB99_9PEZI|nr:hypothetical protein B0T25DRAFT_267387 [Lasiosphaeria hispida]